MMEDAESGVNNCLVIQLVGNAQARIEVQLARILQLPAGAVQAGNADAAREVSDGTCACSGETLLG